MTLKNVSLFIISICLLMSCQNEVTVKSAQGAMGTVTADLYLNTLVEAYLYGYPLLLMNYTQQLSTNTIKPHPVIPRAPINQLGHYRKYPDHNSKAVVKPNVDTYYSIAWFDLSQGPQLLHMPATDRYYLLPFYDAFTNVFASPGTRTHGQQEVNLMIVGPDHQGDAVDGYELIQSPTYLAWMIARIETYDDNDGNTVVRRIQDHMDLRPLSAIKDTNYHAPLGQLNPTLTDMIPVQKMENLSISEYINELTSLLAKERTAPYDSAIIHKLSTIGIEPGRPFELPKDNFVLKQKLEAVPRIIHKRMRDRKSKGDTSLMINNWTMLTSKLGDYRDDYLMRSYVSFVGLGANLAQDAIYPFTTIDADGHPLDGAKEYFIHMESHELPPAKAFWSLTAYNEDDFLIENEVNKYAINSKDSLQYNADGSLDLIISASPPKGMNRNNWLPVSSYEGFSLTMRIYWPEERALDGEWMPPLVNAQ